MENEMNAVPAVDPSEDPQMEVESRSPEIDQTKLEFYLDGLRTEQNLPMAIVGGLLSALVCALIWAGITVAIKYQIGYMAIAVGLGVGFSVRFMGKGLDKSFGFIGAFFALLGCVLGNYLSTIGFASTEFGLGYADTFNLIPLSMIPEIMVDSFSPMDLLFYGLAAYEGYKFAFRNITDEDILANASA